MELCSTYIGAPPDFVSLEYTLTYINTSGVSSVIEELIH